MNVKQEETHHSKKAKNEQPNAEWNQKGNFTDLGYNVSIVHKFTN